ncbi:hypothetical protein CTI12_AA464520 [Artemisia annua]|uniref:Uncharacterized protein n=1 Tax=Artemisia annua TaxID=35608 RepID=A0A2U1LQX0_ARTAN|nr:hypothetical protein CTI12_AA464520 [Artemisia annua]
MVPMHRSVHEPLVIPEKAMKWMKKHNLPMGEDARLFPSSSLPRTIKGGESSYRSKKCNT